MDEDILRVTCAAPRDSVEQDVHLKTEENTGKPAESVAIFLKNTNFRVSTKIFPCLIETDDDNAINLDLNADTIFPDRVYLMQ